MKKLNENKYIVVKYGHAPWWIEWGAYLGIVVLFASIVVTNSMYLIAAMAGALLFWNFRLFSILRMHIDHLNDNEFNMLLGLLEGLANNNQEDGTFPVQESLTKEEDNERQ
jgi:hypothetical protein